MVTIQPATLQEIRDAWPFFLNGVAEVVDKCKADFHPADVYHEIASGNAFLYWVEQDGEAVGFTVISEYKDRYSQIRTLSLDMTYLEPHSDALFDLRECVDDLARQVGITRIEWFSPRVGWDRVMESLGYTSDSKLFVREVPRG